MFRRAIPSDPGPMQRSGELHARPRRRIPTGLIGDEGGATAVEFAFVAIPFFALLFGILELALVFILSTALDNAVSTAARSIRTGNNVPSTAAGFAALICQNLGLVSPATCQGNIRVEVQTFPTYAAMTAPNPVMNNQLRTQAQMAYNPGGAEAIVLVRSYYPWPIFAPLLTQAVSRTSSGQTLVTSTMAFRSEPYS